MAPRLLSLAVLLVVAPSTLADAAILIEAQRQHGSLRIVIDAEHERALIATPRGQSVIDLGARGMHVDNGPGQLPDAAGIAAPGGYRVTPWGPGPMIAGHATVYHVITHGDDICAEMLVSGWMQPFVAPVVEALDELDGTAGRGSGCARIPFAVYAAAGWPMLAGKIDHLTVETRTIRFDYSPTAGERALLDDGWLGAIRDAMWPGG
jgi:hypothetical protein